MSIVYLNGDFIPSDQAMISPMDRGFLFGDGVYEVLPVYNNKIFRFEQHIKRLERSLAGIRLPLATTLEQWRTILDRLLELNADLGRNQSIYLQVTRGTAQTRNHAFPPECQPTVFVFTYSLKTLPYEQLAQGMNVITLDDIRWQLCNIKSIALLANVLLYQEAIDKTCAETILIRDGYALEGATSNLLIVKDGIIKTPPLSSYILGGVTRDLVLQLARDHNIPVMESNITESELHNADEVWITSSTREIYPIVKVDQTVINPGTPGPVWQKMIRFYHDFINHL